MDTIGKHELSISRYARKNYPCCQTVVVFFDPYGFSYYDQEHSTQEDRHYVLLIQEIIKQQQTDKPTE
jgi:hypothetical protein